MLHIFIIYNFYKYIFNLEFNKSSRYYFYLIIKSVYLQIELKYIILKTRNLNLKKWEEENYNFHLLELKIYN